MIGLGLPMAFGVVPPNRIYGFRTRATLEDPAVWYPVNRIAGWWCVAIGAVSACVALGTSFSPLSMPTFAIVTAATLMVGIVAMAVHGANSRFALQAGAARD